MPNATQVGETIVCKKSSCGCTGQINGAVALIQTRSGKRGLACCSAHARLPTGRPVTGCGVMQSGYPYQMHVSAPPLWTCVNDGNCATFFTRVAQFPYCRWSSDGEVPYVLVDVDKVWFPVDEYVGGLWIVNFGLFAAFFSMFLYVMGVITRRRWDERPRWCCRRKLPPWCCCVCHRVRRMRQRKANQPAQKFSGVVVAASGTAEAGAGGGATAPSTAAAVPQAGPATQTQRPSAPPAGTAAGVAATASVAVAVAAPAAAPVADGSPAFSSLLSTLENAVTAISITAALRDMAKIHKQSPAMYVCADRVAAWRVATLMTACDAWYSFPPNAKQQIVDVAVMSRSVHDEAWDDNAREELRRLLKRLPDAPAVAV